MRFVRSATLLMLFVSIAGAFYRFDFSLAVREIGISLALVPLAIFFTVLAGALAARFSANVATALSFIAVGFSLPVFGSHYLADAVVRDAPVPWGYVALTYAAAAPLVAAAAFAGVHFINTREV